tara:strand:+ start:2869 stop:3537 length:669 start_codon:yes stop_codon:yes gene_type:complete
MDPRKSVTFAYDSIGSDFGKKRTNTWDFVVEWLNNLISKNTQKELKILIAGCGNGRHVRLAEELGFKVSAIDISSSMVNATIKAEKECGRSGENIFKSDVCNLQFIDDEFDAIMCIAVLHHLPSELNKIALNEFSRVIKKNGEILISCWDPSAPSVINGIIDSENEDVVWVSWTLPDSSKISRYYHLPNIEMRSKVWNNIEGLNCINFELNNFNQLFYFVKV